MGRQGKRIVSAWLLTSIYVSMMLLSALHLHQPTENTEIDCVECAHHVHHSGHFIAAGEHLDNCVLCQFTNLVYTPATTLLVPISFDLTILALSNDFDFNSSEVSQYKSSRAPPIFL